jgi:D-amino-acid dehydrogenase
LRLPGDETGDCFKFTQGLAALAAGLGVDFRYGVTIQGLEVEGARVTGVRTDQGVVTSEAYVVALGSHSPALLRPFGVGLPIYPVKGYSITVPIKDVDRAPVSTLLDESFKIAITRLGDRIRVGGMAELSGYSTDLPLARRRTLEHCLESLFPGAGVTEEASFWSGLRPMTPDSVPLIGPCALGDLFLNTGHGTLGWTMACGSAQVVADQISGVRPAIETQDLSLARSPA